MKFIIVIRGVSEEEYISIRHDLRLQFADRRWDVTNFPVFAKLPGDEANIEIVWIDSAMELEHLKLINQQIRKDVTDSTNPATSDDYAALYDVLRQTHI